MNHRTIALFVGATFSVAVAACGEGSDEKSGEGEAEAESEGEAEAESEAEAEAEAEGEGDCGPSETGKNYDGIECGGTDTCFEPEICCFDKGNYSCGTDCTTLISQDCDGPEDCAGGVCCLQSATPKPPHIVCSTCCDYVAPTKTDLVTRVCHDSTECSDTAAPICCSAFCLGCSGYCYDSATAAMYEKDASAVCDD